MPVPIIEAEPGKTFVTGSGDVPGPQGLPYLQDAVLGLKAFHMGPQQVLALDMSTWSAHVRDLDGIAVQLQEALSRLLTVLPR